MNKKARKSFERYIRPTAKQLKVQLESELKELDRETKNGDGFLYSPGTLPILLTAHMDTVHKEPVKMIVCTNGEMRSPQGIGGDDRCGIYMIMQIIRELPCHVIFFEDEEIGGIGSEKFCETKLCKSLIGEFKYAIDLDRANSHDAVFYNCWNEDFISFVTKEFWKEEFGTFTDICNICPTLDCAGVNLSCGYYKAHTKDEYIVLDEMEKAIEETKKLIKRTKEKDWFEYVEDYYEDYHEDYHEDYKDYGYYHYEYSTPRSSNTLMKGKSSWWDLDTYEITYANIHGELISEIVDAVSEEEAVGYFLINNPEMCFGEIVRVELI